MFWLRFSLLFKLAYLGKADMPKKYMLYQNISITSSFSTPVSLAGVDQRGVLA